MENKNYFEVLNNINVQDKVEKKNGLSYLSWAWAWGEIKKIHPDANYVIYERESEYGPINYFTDGKTCWVKTGVIVNGIEHIEELPVMDFRNKSIPLDSVTSFDINKTIQRSLTKAVARHGLGLYIYAGEDLPEETTPAEITEEVAKEYTFTFGKYNGRKLIELIEEENGYIDWLLNNSKDEYLLKCIEVLSGQVPLNEDEQNEILDLIDKMMDLELKTGSDHEAILKHYKVKSNNDMTVEQLNDCISKLEKKLKGE
jgi:hypothetical protein